MRKKKAKSAVTENSPNDLNDSNDANELAVSVTLRITLKRVSDLLVSAFEGGSNYWYRIDKVSGKPAHSLHSFVWSPGEGAWDGKPHAADYALNPGCSLTISARGDSGRDTINGKKSWTLDLAAIEKGLHVMAEKFPKHFGDFLCENDDATTADVFLQCCVFGDIIYG